ncbi:MAG: fibronectin type III domain-containing protein [Pseudomonadota bacterium]
MQLHCHHQGKRIGLGLGARDSVSFGLGSMCCLLVGSACSTKAPQSDASDAQVRNDAVPAFVLNRSKTAAAPVSSPPQQQTPPPSPPSPLAMPANLVATAEAGMRIGLRWVDTSRAERGFIIERQLRGPKRNPDKWVEIARTPADATSYSDGAVAEGTTYAYRVRAFAEPADSAPLSLSAPSSEAVSTAPLAEPVELIAKAISTTQLELRWQDGSRQERGFRVERSSTVGGGAGGWRSVGTLPANATRFLDTKVEESSTYAYRVVATGATTESFPSATVQATSIPASPLSLRASATSPTQVRLEWQDASRGERGFRVERTVSPLLASSSWVAVGTVGANATSLVDDGLLEHTRYGYRAIAFSDQGDSVPSPPVEIATMLAPPRELTASSSSATETELSWQDSSFKETGFVIERAADQKGAPDSWKEVGRVAANANRYRDSRLHASTWYWYRARSFADEARSPKVPERRIAQPKQGRTVPPLQTEAPAPQSASAQARSDASEEVRVRTKMAAPRGLWAASVSYNQIDLAWIDDNRIKEGFRLERAADSSGAPGEWKEVVQLDASRAKYSDFLLGSGRFWYRVRSYDGAETSAYSGAVTASTLLIPPSGLSATAVSPTQVKLKWLDRSQLEQGYVVERAEDQNRAPSAWAEIGRVPANVQDHSDEGLRSGTRYWYRVAAFAGRESSSHSAPTLVATKLEPPTNLVATATGANRISLSWSDHSASETAFYIERASERHGADVWFRAAEATANATTFDDEQVQPDTKYWYRVQASATSSIVSAFSNQTVARTTLAAPSALAVAIDGELVVLTWKDVNQTESGFRVERAPDQGGSPGTWSRLADTEGDTRGYVDRTTVAGTTYWFRVKAYRFGHGSSVFSNEVKATR